MGCGDGFVESVVLAWLIVLCLMMMGRKLQLRYALLYIY